MTVEVVEADTGAASLEAQAARVVRDVIGRWVATGASVQQAVALA